MPASPEALRAAGNRDRRHLALAACAVLLTAADTYVVVVALPSIMTGVGVGLDRLQRATPIISGFLLGYTAVLPLIGRLADLAGTDPVFAGCLSAFGIGPVVTATAHALPVVVAGRALQGVGGGGLVPVTQAMVAARWPPDARGLPLGLVGALQELGSVAGPLYGAAIVAVASWRAIFWINVPVTVVLGGGFWLTRSSPAPSAAPSAAGPRASPTLARCAGRRGRLASPSPAPAPAWGCPPSARPDRPGARRRRRSRLHGRSRQPCRPGQQRRRGPAVDAGRVGGVGAVHHPDRARRRGRCRGVLVLGALRSIQRAGCSPRSSPGGYSPVPTCRGRRCWPPSWDAWWSGSTADPSRQVVASSAPFVGPVAVALIGLFYWRQRHASAPMINSSAGRPAGVGRLGRQRGPRRGADGRLGRRSAVRPGHGGPQLGGGRRPRARPLPRGGANGVIGGALCRSRSRAPVVAATGMAMAAVSFVAMASWSATALGGGPSWSDVALVMCGLGFGSAIAPVNVAILGAVRPNVHALASALAVAARTIGMLAGLSATAIGVHRFYAAQARIGSPLVLCPANPGSCPAYDTATTQALLSEMQTPFLPAPRCARRRPGCWRWCYCGAALTCRILPPCPWFHDRSARGVRAAPAAQRRRTTLTATSGDTYCGDEVPARRHHR